MSDKPEDSAWDQFRKGFNEEYSKPSSSEPVSDQIKHGLVEGSVETMFHPFRWLRVMLKK